MSKLPFILFIFLWLVTLPACSGTKDSKPVAGDGGATAVQTEGLDIKSRDITGSTALMKAAYEGNIDSVRALLDAGADVNEQDDFGWTALMAAVESGNYSLVQLLLERGADTGIEDIYGTTARSIAGQKKDTQLASLIGIAGGMGGVGNFQWGMTGLNRPMERPNESIDGIHGLTENQEAGLVEQEKQEKPTPQADGKSTPEQLEEIEEPILIAAARKGDIVAVDDLLGKNAAVDEKEKTGAGPLW